MPSTGPIVAPPCALDMVDLLSRRRDHPPGSAELVETLPRRLPGLPVGDEVVERVAVVGDLELAVAALGRAEQGGLHTRSGDGFAGGEERRPQRRAGAVATADDPLVLR